MVRSWEEIHALEMKTDFPQSFDGYPEVLEALEERLADDSEDLEAVIRLAFNLWWIVCHDTVLPDEDGERYAERFMQLFNEYKNRSSDNADFCFAFGLPMVVQPIMPGAGEDQGEELLQRAARLDAFYESFSKNELTQEELAARFRGRGVFAWYYAIDA